MAINLNTLRGTTPVATPAKESYANRIQWAKLLDKESKAELYHNPALDALREEEKALEAQLSANAQAKWEIVNSLALEQFKAVMAEYPNFSFKSNAEITFSEAAQRLVKLYAVGKSNISLMTGEAKVEAIKSGSFELYTRADGDRLLPKSAYQEMLALEEYFGDFKGVDITYLSALGTFQNKGKNVAI